MLKHGEGLSTELRVCTINPWIHTFLNVLFEAVFFFLLSQEKNCFKRKWSEQDMS